MSVFAFLRGLIRPNKRSVGSTVSAALVISLLSSVSAVVIAAAPASAAPPGEIDYAASFDGGNYFTSTNQSGQATNAVWDLGSSDFTMEMWVKVDKMPGDGMLVMKEQSWGLAVDATAGFKYVFSSNWAWNSTNYIPRIGVWQHIALSKSVNTVNFYVDGQLVHTATNSTNIPATIGSTIYPVSIGMRSGTSATGYTFTTPFYGAMDEFRLYKSVRSASTIQSDLRTYGNVNDSNLKVYYDFNEGSGTVLDNRVAGASSSTNLFYPPSSNTATRPSWNDEIGRAHV